MDPKKTNPNIDIIEANDKAIDRTKRLYVAALTREARGPTEFGGLYGPKLAKVVKPSPVADAVNPTPSMPHDEVQAVFFGLTIDYKGALFNVKKDPERQEEPHPQGLGRSSSGG